MEQSHSPETRALLALVLTPHIRQYLVECDPQALGQAVAALKPLALEELRDAGLVECHHPETQEIEGQSFCTVCEARIENVEVH
jgi:hypothetical protein